MSQGLARRADANAYIYKWLERVLPFLDSPEVLVEEINSVCKPWDEAKARIVIQTPVEYSAAIANMGVAIIYDILNNREPDLICERAYYPEPKLRKRMVQNGVPLFSKESCHPLCQFDMLAISSYYPLQILAIPDILELSHLNPLASKRTQEDPIVALAGITTFNPEPAADFVDIIFIGEGELQSVEMARVLKEEKSKGPGWKNRFLFRCQTEIVGAYVPAWYEETYGESVEGVAALVGHKPISDSDLWELLKDTEGIKKLFDAAPRVKTHFPLGPACSLPKFEHTGILPAVIKKALMEDVSAVEPLHKMFVSNSDGQAMSAGSLMMSYGCSNSCRFCQASWIQKPFRERSYEVVVDGFKKLIKETGAVAVTPYALNLSDHSRVQDIVHFLLNDENRKVSMSSQRLDYFSRDFATAAFLSGNRSITVAIECGSEKMRRRSSKNLSENVILDAFRTIFDIGFQSVKVYMVAGLPLEEEDEVEGIIKTARAIHKLQQEVQGDRAVKTRIRFSWTPFTSKNATPMQWCHLKDVDFNTGLPVLSKTLEPALDVMRGLGYKFRIGTSSELSIVNQCITNGDRRMGGVILDIHHHPRLGYSGGMSVGKHPLQDFLEILNKHKLSFKYFLREKSLSELLPWDFIHTGVFRSFMESSWIEYQEARNGEICFDECDHCGACTPKTMEYFRKRRDGELLPSKASVTEALDYVKLPLAQRVRLRISIKERYRYVHVSKLKMQLRRAACLAELPVKSEIVLASDKFLFQNWAFGTDYAELQFYNKTTFSEAELRDLLNKNLFSMKVEEVRYFSPAATGFRTDFNKVGYKVKMPLRVISKAKVDAAFKQVLDGNSFIVHIKEKGTTRDTWNVVELECRKKIHNLWTLNRDSEGMVEIRMLLSGAVTPYDILPEVFKTPKRTILAFPVERIDFFMNQPEGEMDMFALLCQECGAVIESNMFDTPVDMSYCLSHYHLIETKE